VGKTVFTAHLVRHWLSLGFRARAVKPFCSGGREDARILAEAQGVVGGVAALDGLNPWHFRAALTPWVAARREGRAVGLGEVDRYLEEARTGCEALLVEGAGGLLSPLGDGYDARTLIGRLRARPVVVAANRLGCLNQVLLTVEALGSAARRAVVVMMQPPRRGLAARTNLEVLKERLGAERVVVFPWIPGPDAARRSGLAGVRAALDAATRVLRGGDAGA
jgi:dethiobiotin synthetase